MANLFQQGQQAQPPAQQMNPAQLLQQLRQNPVSVMKNYGYDIPQELAGNPLGIFNHLVQTGQVQQARAAQIQSLARQMARR